MVCPLPFHKSINRKELAVTQITREIDITITETKRGAGVGKSYITTVGNYIDLVRNMMDPNGELSVMSGIGQPDEDGDYEEYRDEFNDLPVSEQFSRCIKRHEDRQAVHLTWEVLAF